MPRLTCDQALTLLDEARSGIPAEATGDLNAHLMQCDDCWTQTEAIFQGRTLMGTVEVPPALSQDLTAIIDDHLSHQLRARIFETSFGWAGIVYSDNGLLFTRWSLPSREDAYDRLHEKIEDFILQEKRRDDIGHDATRKLKAYHQGRRVQFDEPFDFSLVSPFTQQVLRATARIPYGEVRPYAWVARQIGRPKAVRAVGQALHINPLAPIIPCHRVIASDNTLGGYGGGPDLKRRLLKMEGYLS